MLAETILQMKNIEKGFSGESGQDVYTGIAADQQD